MTGFQKLDVEGTPSLQKVFEDAAKRVYLLNGTVYDKWSPKKVRLKKRTGKRKEKKGKREGEKEKKRNVFQDTAKSVILEMTNGVQQR